MKEFTKKSLDELAQTMKVIPEDERKNYWGMYGNDCFWRNVLFLFLILVFNHIKIHAIFIYPNDNCEKTHLFDIKTDSDLWHPKAFYISYPDMTLTIYLPYEKDRSGVHNLLFKCKESGDIHLLDTVKINEKKDKTDERFFNRLYGNFDVILLYNNGKYIQYSEVVFKKNSHTNVNMKNLKIQPCDSASQQWLNMRSFTSIVGNDERVFDQPLVSQEKTQGYIFVEHIPYAFAGSDGDPAVIIKKNNDIKKVNCTFDGYFEIDYDDERYPLEFNCWNLEPGYLNVIINSGVFFVLEGYDLEEYNKRFTGPPVIRKKIKSLYIEKKSIIDSIPLISLK